MDTPVWKNSPHSKMYAALKVITEDPQNRENIDHKALQQAEAAIEAAQYERRFFTRPAFDRRDPDPRKDYGIAGLQIGMVLIGPTASVSFVILTNWYLPHVRLERNPGEKFAEFRIGVSDTPAMGADVSVHRDVHRDEPEDWMKESDFISPQPCDWRPGGKCWSDGSALAAGDFIEVLIAEGIEAVWKKMETWMPEAEAEVDAEPGGVLAQGDE